MPEAGNRLVSSASTAVKVLQSLKKKDSQFGEEAQSLAERNKSRSSDRAGYRLTTRGIAARLQSSTPRWISHFGLWRGFVFVGKPGVGSAAEEWCFMPAEPVNKRLPARFP